jgi:eukaryotic translation initiation factor 2C
VDKNPPLIRYGNPQGKVTDELRAAGMGTKEKYGALPDLIVAILPEGGNDIYTKIK